MPGTGLSAAASCVAAGPGLPNTATGCPAPRREVRGRARTAPATESGWPRNDSLLVSPLALQPVMPTRQAAEDERGDHPDDARPARRCGGRRRAHRPRRRRLRPCRSAGLARPEHPAAGDHQQRRAAASSSTASADGDADRQHRTQALGGVQLGEQQGQQAERSPCRRWRRWPGPARRRATGHGLMPVLVPAQFLAVAGRRAAGRSRCPRRTPARQDARALRVHGQPGVLGEQVDDGLGDDQRNDGGDAPAAATAPDCDR